MTVETARPSVNGRLHVEGSALCDASGHAVQLRGVSGDGRIDFASAVEWFSYLNQQKISYAIWSLSDKDESSAFFKTGFHPYGKIREKDLSTSGKWVRELIRGTDPETKTMHLR